jgi:hypothetical protein
MPRARSTVLAILAIVLSLVAAGATSVAMRPRQALAVHEIPGETVTPTVVVDPPPGTPIEPITDAEDPVVIASRQVANDVIAHGGGPTAHVDGEASGTAPARHNASEDDPAGTKQRERTGDTATTRATERGALGGKVRDEMLEMLLCMSGNDNYCLMGNESAFWVGESNMTRMSEPQIANVIKRDGGYVALCVRGTLTTFEATEQDPDTGFWEVNIRHIDTSLSTSSTRLAEYNDGDVFWVGGERDLPVVERAPRRRKVDLEGKIWRGVPVPAE